MHALRMALISLCLVLAAGCATPDLHYQPGMKQGELGRLAGVNTCLDVFAEGRESLPGGGPRQLLLYVPGVVSVRDTVQRTDEEVQKESEGRSAVVTGTLPMASYALWKEMRRAGLFDEVDLEPMFREDYDVLLKPKLLNTREETDRFSYGLGPIGVMLTLLPVRAAKVVRHFDYELVAEDAASGATLARAAGAGRFEYDISLWGFGSDDLAEVQHRQVKTWQEVHRAVLTQLVPALQQRFSAAPADIEGARARRYAERLDPELREFRTYLEEARAEGRTADPVVVAVAAAYRQKRALLEDLRKTEREALRQVQVVKLLAFEQRMDLDRDYQQAVIDQATAGMVEVLSAYAYMNPMSMLSARKSVQGFDDVIERRLGPHFEELSDWQKDAIRRAGGDPETVRAAWLASYHQRTPSLDEAREAPSP